MKNSKIFIFIIGTIFSISIILSLILFMAPNKGTIANIYEDGVCIKSIDLSKVTKGYEITLENEHGTNIITVEKDRISITEANCPDKVCVDQGWISNTTAPIVCLPHKVVIKLEETSKSIEFDSLSQ